MAIDHDFYFARWEFTFPGRFLSRDRDDQLVVNIATMMELMPACSTGEQVFAAIWYECYAQRAAPWIADGLSALSLLGVLDWDLRSEAIAHIAKTWTHRGP